MTVDIWLCRSAALPPLSPLRTVRATFTAYSSDNSKFSSHKTKSAHPPLMRVNFPIKFPFGTYVSGFLLSSASRSMLPKSGRKDWLHTSLLRVCKSVCLPASFISTKIASFSQSLYLKPKNQSRLPTFIKYLSFIHFLDLFVCLR